MNELTELAQLAQKQVDLQAQLDDLETHVTHVKGLLREVQEEQIPALMLSIGMASFKLSDGSAITVKDEIYASIPKEKYNVALDWLREHDFDAIIKTQVTTDFGKGEDQEAQRVVEALRDLGVPAQVKSAVHPMTLKAFIKEQLNAGYNIPLEVFGAHVVKKSIINLPKD
jgi:hypothetical protein